MDRRGFLRGGVPMALVLLAGCSGGEGTPTGETASAARSPTASQSPTDGSGGGATGTPTDVSTTTDGDDPTGSSPTESSTPTEMQTATDEPSTTDEPTDTGSPAATESSTTTPSPDREVVVGPNGTLTFQPQSFTISAGETVLWRWESGGHNVSPTEGEQPSGANWPGKDESTYPAGTAYSYVFDVPGEYAYHCDPHQSVGMVGSFTVE